MLSLILVTLAIASLATNPDMKTNFVNYTTPESGRIMDSSGVTLNPDNAENKSIERDKSDAERDELRNRKLSQECQGRKVCKTNLSETDEVLNIAPPTSATNDTNMTRKVIIETQIQATYKKFHISERTTEEGSSADNLITSSTSSLKESGKKFKLDVREKTEKSTESSHRTDNHKFFRPDEVSGSEVLKEVVRRNMNSVATTRVPEKTLQQKNKMTVISTEGPRITPHSPTSTISDDNFNKHSIWTTHSSSYRESKLFSQVSTTSPSRSDNSKSNVLSGKNLNDTDDFSGSSLRPTWETTRARTVVDHNLQGKTRNFTISPTTRLSPTISTESVPQVSTEPPTPKPKTYGIVKYVNETRRRPSGPIANLKSHMEATYRTHLNAITTETSRDLETFVVDAVTETRSVFDDVASGNSSDSVSRVIQQEIPWPVKKEAVVEGDLVLGGLMMVHEREDTITCGPVMPQGGIQALEAMLYTLDRLNFGPEALLPNITLGAHILDDCDKDTYGLEMAVDFIKGRMVGLLMK